MTTDELSLGAPSMYEILKPANPFSSVPALTVLNDDISFTILPFSSVDQGKLEVGGRQSL